MKKSFTFILVLIFFIGNLFADPISEKEAKIVAENFYRAYAPATKVDALIEKGITEKYNNVESFYVFEFSSNSFVIVSADDNAEPILGFSFSNPFGENIGSNTRFLLDRYKKEIWDIKNSKISNDEIKEKWNTIRNAKLSGELKSAGPLLTTIWNQSPYYNKFCPGGSPTGCVATAMSQIMNYHEWPARGQGWHEYIVSEHPEYGNQYANFEMVEYDWNNMPDLLDGTNTETEIDAIAILNRHAGVSVNMGYDPSGSGAMTHDVLYALTNYFKYDPNSILYVEYNQANEEEYFDLLKKEIDEGRPIYYDGYGESGGHAWVCDGYLDNGLVHINWGWGGSANGYFQLADMTPGSADFTDGNSMIIGIKPGTNYQDIQWVKQASGFDAQYRAIQNISVVNNRVAWASSRDFSGGGAKVKDFTRTVDGNNWISGTINAAGTLNYSISMITAVNDTTAWAALFGPTGGGMIVKTTDGGINWTEQPTADFNGPNGFPNVIHFWDENNGWCQGDPNGGYFEMYTTDNGGETWTRVPEGNIPANLSEEYGRVTHMAVYGNIVWFSTDHGRIFKSTDKGLTWDVFQGPLTNSSYKMTFKNENIGVMFSTDLTNSIAYKTTNGGESWSLLSYTGNLYFSDISYVPDTNLLISTGSDWQTPHEGVSYSTDDGATWTDYADYYKNFEFFAIGAKSIEAIWAGGYNLDKHTDGVWHYGPILDTVDYVVDERNECTGISLTFEDKSLETHDSYEWEFGDGATPLTATGPGPHVVEYTIGGYKDIKLVVTDGAVEDSIVKSDYIYIASNLGSIGSIAGDINVDVFSTHSYSVPDLEEVNYTWSLPTDWYGMSLTNEIDVTFVNNVTESIQVTPSNICGDGTPLTLEITANCVPTPSPGVISGDISVNVDDVSTYSVVAQDYMEYNWILPTDWYGSSTTNSITVTFDGGPVIDSIKVYASSICGESDTTFLEITASPSTSILDDQINNDNVIIYPVPAKDYLKIKGINNSRIAIYNTEGRLVKAINNYTEESAIQVSDLKTGIYYIQIIYNGKSYTKAINVKN